MTDLSRVMTPFAASIWAKTRALIRFTDLPKPLIQRLRESVSDDLKKATNFHPHRQSVAARKVAKSLGVELPSKTWHDQPKFDRKRRLFVVEHKVPVATLREQCLQANAESGVLDVLTNRLVVVWVLRKEDDRLRRLGFRSSRPDPALAYRKARIKIFGDVTTGE